MSRREEREEIHLLTEIRDLLHEYLSTIADDLAVLVALLVPKQPFSTTAVLSLQGDPTMPTLTLNFTDDTGTNQAAPAGDGSGLVVTFASDGTSTVDSSGVAGTNADGFVNYSTPITVVDDGLSNNLSAVVSNTSGAPLLDDDGTTAFVQPPPIVFTAPGAPPAQATTGVLSVTP